VYSFYLVFHLHEARARKTQKELISAKQNGVLDLLPSAEHHTQGWYCLIYVKKRTDNVIKV